MANGPSINLPITATDNASRVFSKVGDKGEETGHRIAGAFSKAGDFIGGEFGELLNKGADGIERLGDAGQSMGAKIAVGGAAVAAVGTLLVGLGSKEKEATAQLKVAIDNTGSSYSDYQEEIEKTVRQQENFNHSATDTKAALQVLTQATQDPTKALDVMGITADLAAAKHITLAEAAGLVAKILNGTGTKTLKSYGIVMGDTGDKTKDAQAALDELGRRLDGQASASVSGFTSKVDILATKLGDRISEAGQKFGSVIQWSGTIVGLAASAQQLLAARAERAAAALTVEAASAGTAAVATEELAVSSDAAAASTGRFHLGTIGAAAGVAALGVGLYEAGSAIVKWNERNDTLFHTMNNATDAHNKFATALGESRGVIDENVTSTVKAVIEQDNFARSALKAGFTVDDLTTAVTGGDQAFAVLYQRLKDSGKVSKETLMAFIDLYGQFKTNKDQADRLASSTTKAASASDAMAAALQAEAQQAWDTAKAAADLTNKFKTYFSMTDANLDGQLGFAESLDKLKDSVKQGGTALGANTQAGRDNIRALEAGWKAAGQWAESQITAGVSAKQATDTYNANIEALKKQAYQIGLSKAEVDALVATYGTIPPEITTQIKLDIETRAATHYYDYFQQYGNASNASGGYPSPGDTMNEAGGELVQTRAGDLVIPHGRSQELLNGANLGGGGSTFVQNVTINWTSPVSPSLAESQKLLASLQPALQAAGKRI